MWIGWQPSGTIVYGGVAAMPVLLNVQIPDEMHQRITRASRSRGKSINRLIAEALEQTYKNDESSWEGVRADVGLSDIIVSSGGKKRDVSVEAGFGADLDNTK